MRGINLVFILIFLISCQQSGQITTTEFKGPGKTVFEVGKLVGGEYQFTNKTLDQIDGTEIIDGTFVYKKDGALVISTIDSELDAELVKGIPVDHKPDTEVMKDSSGVERQFTKFNNRLLNTHPTLSRLDRNFFMEDYDVNWMCASYLDSYQRLKKCGFSLACEINADFYFEKWCFRRVAELTGDESWCDNIRLNIDWDCTKSLAYQKKNETLCWKLKASDINAMACFKHVANLKQDPVICDQMTQWYSEHLQAAGKDIALADALAREQGIDECRSKASMFNNTMTLADCRSLDFDGASACVAYVHTKDSSLKRDDCFNGGFKFAKLGICLDEIAPNLYYQEAENSAGSNLCGFRDVPNGVETKLTGRIYSFGITGNLKYIELLPAYPSTISCSDVDCFGPAIPIYDMAMFDGITLIVKKDDHGKCMVVNSTQIFK